MSPGRAGRSSVSSSFWPSPICRTVHGAGDIHQEGQVDGLPVGEIEVLGLDADTKEVVAVVERIGAASM